MKEHACGLLLTDTEAEAIDAVPPGKVIFARQRGSDFGDIWLDSYDTGWGSESDAQAAALYFGTVLLYNEVEGPQGVGRDRR